jgi:glycosyltransferase involved in cell wall biosynthesis
MNAALNGRFLSRRVTGVERYGREILCCLEDRLRVVRPKHMRRRMCGHIWEQFILPGQIHSDEILWSPANIGPLVVANQVLTLHDLSPLEHPEWFAPAFARWYRMLIPSLAKRVRHIVVPSSYTREKVLQRFSLAPDRVTVIPGGVDTRRFHPNNCTVLGMPNRYILFVGSLQPRKNLGVLLQAWKQISHHHCDVWLYIAGAEDNIFYKNVLPKQAERVRFLDYVPEADLPGLYANADAFVMPSLDEGFCLPILEAMACGTPVVAAGAGALPEVIGDAGLLFDPANPADLTSTLEHCLSDEGLRRILIDKGSARVESFSWLFAAEKVWETLQSCH